MRALKQVFLELIKTTMITIVGANVLKCWAAITIPNYNIEPIYQKCWAAGLSESNVFKIILSLSERMS